MLNMYGLKNCDTVKKARAWLQAQGTEFNSVTSNNPAWPPNCWWSRSKGPQPELRKPCSTAVSTTWRGLPTETQASVTDQASAFALMQAHPSLIKRPVMVWPHTITVGFEPGLWATHLAALRN